MTRCRCSGSSGPSERARRPRAAVTAGIGAEKRGWVLAEEFDRRVDHHRARDQLGERATDLSVPDRASLAERPFDHPEGPAAPGEPIGPVRRPVGVERDVQVRRACLELAHVDGGVRRVADTEQEDVPAGSGEASERAVDAGRSRPVVPVDEISGAGSDGGDRIGRVVRAQRVGTATERLCKRPRTPRQVGRVDLVVVRERRHDDEAVRPDGLEQRADHLVRVESDRTQGRVDDDGVAAGEPDHRPSRPASVPPRIASRTSGPYGASVTRASSIGGSPNGASVEKNTRPPMPSGSAAARAVGHST